MVGALLQAHGQDAIGDPGSGLFVTLHYLEAIKATGTDDSATVIKKMEETPVNDMYTKNGVIRKDGLLVHDMYLMQVKTPAESKKPWDYYNVREVVPGNEAYPSIAKGSCTFAKQ